MDALEQFRAALPEAAKDTKLNLQAVLQPGLLTADARLGTALASAYTARHLPLIRALEAKVHVDLPEQAAAVLDDAKAASTLMAMNNVFYKFRHMVGKPEYADKPARLRMNRLAQPATSKATFELISLAVSAINGCEMCVRAHEDAVTKAGLTSDHVHEAVRIASVISAAAAAGVIAELENPR